MNKLVFMITFSFLNQTLWCDTHWNRLSEMIPISGNITGFGWEIRKLAFWKLSILDLICCPGWVVPDQHCCTPIQRVYLVINVWNTLWRMVTRLMTSAICSIALYWLYSALFISHKTLFVNGFLWVRCRLKGIYKTIALGKFG